MTIKHIIPFFLIGIFLFSCGKDKQEGYVGEYYSVQAEKVEPEGDYVYTWIISKQPDASRLTAEDLELSAGNTTVSFIPDKPGTYTLEVLVEDEYGDEVSSQVFTFEILAREDAEAGDEAESLAAPGTTGILVPAAIQPPAVPPAAAFTPPPAVKPRPTPAKPPARMKSRRAPEKPLPGSSIPKDQDRYTIQITAKKTFPEAQEVARQLEESGYDAYIQKAYFKETDEIWYRVRIGSFESFSAAKAVAGSIESISNTPAWVDHVRLEN